MMRYFAVMLAVLAISGSPGVKAQQTCESLSQTCQVNSADQCFNSCCFSAGSCGSSSANNCEAPLSSQFGSANITITPSDRMPNHQVSEFNVDGCICNTNRTETGITGAGDCNSTTPHCWGKITCSDPNKTCGLVGLCNVRTHCSQKALCVLFSWNDGAPLCGVLTMMSLFKKLFVPVNFDVREQPCSPAGRLLRHQWAKHER